MTAGLVKFSLAINSMFSCWRCRSARIPRAIAGSTAANLSSIAAERFHPLHAGQALSLYVSASGIGMFVGPPLWGAVVDLAGYRVMFAASGVVLALNAILFVAWQRRSKQLRTSSRSAVYH